MHTLFTHGGVDGRTLFRFDMQRYVGDKDNRKLVDAGWSMSVYADNKVEAIKRIVAMTSPTVRFKVTEVEPVMPMNVPFGEALSKYNGVVL